MFVLFIFEIKTVKKAPPANTQVNITSANTERAVSVNTEAIMKMLRADYRFNFID